MNNKNQEIEFKNWLYAKENNHKIYVSNRDGCGHITKWVDTDTCIRCSLEKKYEYGVAKQKYIELMITKDIPDEKLSLYDKIQAARNQSKNLQRINIKERTILHSSDSNIKYYRVNRLLERRDDYVKACFEIEGDFFRTKKDIIQAYNIVQNELSFRLNCVKYDWYKIEYTNNIQVPANIIKTRKTRGTKNKYIIEGIEYRTQYEISDRYKISQPEVWRRLKVKDFVRWNRITISKPLPKLRWTINDKEYSSKKEINYDYPMLSYGTISNRINSVNYLNWNKIGVIKSQPSVKRYVYHIEGVKYKTLDEIKEVYNLTGEGVRQRIFSHSAKFNKWVRSQLR